MDALEPRRLVEPPGGPERRHRVQDEFAEAPVAGATHQLVDDPAAVAPTLVGRRDPHSFDLGCVRIDVEILRDVPLSRPERACPDHAFVDGADDEYAAPVGIGSLDILEVRFRRTLDVHALVPERGSVDGEDALAVRRAVLPEGQRVGHTGRSPPRPTGLPALATISDCDMRWPNMTGSLDGRASARAKRARFTGRDRRERPGR